MAKKRKNIPWFWKRKISCPECGHIYKEQDYNYSLRNNDYFDCPRCKVRLSDEEFWESNGDKYSYKIREDFD